MNPGLTNRRGGLRRPVGISTTDFAACWLLIHEAFARAASSGSRLIRFRSINCMTSASDVPR
jgi:hypothetical protein